jgi:peptidoglycan-associated lipoprotein
MQRITLYNLSWFFCFFCFLTVAACSKRPPPRTPSPGASRTRDVTRDQRAGGPLPTVTLAASPSTIERGEQTTLTWETTDTASLVIDSGIGNVADSGSLVVSPRDSTTFTATATGAGGEATASTRVTVVPRSARGMITSTDLDGLQQAVEEGKIQPLFFDYDQAGITADGERVLRENARWFQQFPNATILIEGHCDERGTEEYNLALGDRRAQATKAYLVQLGIASARMETISFGEERPFAPGYDEDAYRLNRRAHFVVTR